MGRPKKDDADATKLNVSGRKNLIYLDDKTAIDPDEGVLFIDGKGLKFVRSQVINLLILLMEHANQYVSCSTILNDIWAKKNQNHFAGEEDVKSLVSKARKLHENIYAKIPPKSTGGYKIVIEQKYIDLYQKRITRTFIQDLSTGPLTNSNITYIDEQDLLCRWALVDQISTLTTQNQSRVLLTGFGGVGKTTIAKRLFCILKDSYDCYGWINYNISLAQSFTSCFLTTDERYDSLTNKNAKWNYIKKSLNTSKKSKLLIIDNVDYIDGLQDPESDEELAGITSWSNVTVIITSRLASIPGFTNTIKIDNLRPDDCIKLFLHYLPASITPTASDKIIIQKICELASYNTMVIELLAKSCKYYTSNLDVFYNGLLKENFKYVNSLPVKTNHYSQKESAANTLIKLFNLKDRSQLEKCILWSFAMLPEMEIVTLSELENWMGYTPGVIDQLTKDSWIQYNSDGFWIHPLIKQAILFNSDNWISLWDDIRSRRTTHTDIISLLSNNELFNDNDTYNTKMRKLLFIDAMSNNGNELLLEDVLNIADFARKNDNRLYALKYYKYAYKYVQNLPDLPSYKSIYTKWKSTYFYGYLLSYTEAGYDKAEQLIKDSITILNYAPENLIESNEIIKLLATSYDHLGYIQCRLHKDIDSLKSADENFKNAILLRKELHNNCPSDKGLLHDYAWSLDNYGSMYANISLDLLEPNKSITKDSLCVDDISEARKISITYLEEALKIRRELCDNSEIAWSLENLAKLLMVDTIQNDRTKDCLDEALDLYRKLDEEQPNQHLASEAKTYMTYGIFLSKIGAENSKIISCFEKAYNLNVVLEESSPGVYTKELTAAQNALTKLQNEIRQPKTL